MKRMDAFASGVNLLILCLLGVAVLPAALQAEGLVHRCGHCGKACQPHVLVEKIIMCPTKVMETRLKPCVTHNCEEREEKYTAFKLVPETRTIKKEVCYLLDEVKSKEIVETQCQLVDVAVTRSKNVSVPHYEFAETCVQKQICSECGPICVEECCMEQKSRMQADVRVEENSEKQLIFHKTSKEIFYCVKTPKTHTIECATEIVQKLEPVEQTRKVMVNIPKIEYQPYEVEVTRMLPKKVLCCAECSKHHR